MSTLKHGHARKRNHTPTYSCWSSMIQRVTNPKRRAWKYYGGRGIKVFGPWRDFERFLKDMGESPGKGFSIERKNPDKNYCPDNCVWMEKTKQWATTRVTLGLLSREKDGRIYTVSAACFVCGVDKGNRCGRCHKCNEYFRRNGVERPLNTKMGQQEKPPAPCSNCKTLSKPITHGRCRRCAQYFRWKGSERPERLFNKPTSSLAASSR